MINVIRSVLDEMGFVVMEQGTDFDITDYIVDSLQFITFIVQIEERLGKIIPDNYLSVDILKSANGLANLLKEI